MIAILLTALLSQPLQAGPLLDASVESARENFITLLNQHRSRKLVIDKNLTDHAQLHAETMAQRHAFDHSFKLRGLRIPAGENVARGQRHARELLHDWFTSAGHTATMLDRRYSRAGVGLSQASDGVWYWSLQLEP